MADTLQSKLTAPEQQQQVVQACQELIDSEVADKSGLAGLAIKAGYKAVKGIRPGFIAQVLRDLLPEFSQALEPIYARGMEAVSQGRAGGIGAYFVGQTSQVAEALLSITDDKAARSNKGIVKGTYDKLRGMAKKNVESAVPRLAQLIEQFAGKS